MIKSYWHIIIAKARANFREAKGHEKAPPGRAGLVKTQELIIALPN
ncbi:hypothetical protein ACFO6W_07100 [Dysgonomonas termitidis]|uniref:Uncharacterized protein n=1 Tax=Dysgonomonas termitidis TaxID=1516126 RepID=A0ABV9KU25_9BACT